MKIRKDHTYITDVYSVEDGPVEDTAPGHLTQGRFKVNYMSVSSINGEIQQVYLKGPGLKADGSLGKTTRARTFFGDYPHWVTDYLNN